MPSSREAASKIGRTSTGEGCFHLFIFFFFFLFSFFSFFLFCVLCLCSLLPCNLRLERLDLACLALRIAATDSRLVEPFRRSGCQSKDQPRRLTAI